MFFKHFLLSHYDYIRFYISKRVLGNIRIWQPARTSLDGQNLSKLTKTKTAVKFNAQARAPRWWDHVRW